jgi:hypothetical protein
MDLSKIKVITNRPAPKRTTQPASKWRDLMAPMKEGHWFQVKCNSMDTKYKSVVNAAQKYCRGRYTFYSPKKGTYIFKINKG